MSNPVGRPATFADPQELYQAFQSYKGEFDEGGILVGDVPDVEGFCDYIDSYRDLLYEYEKKKDFSGTVKRIKNWIYSRKKQLAMQNKMNAAVFIFDAKNNAGYVDKTETDATETVTHKYEDMDDEQIEKLIQSRKNTTT